jgi:hypothetical protein
MTVEQLGIGPADPSNAEGARRAAAQVPDMHVREWHLFYDPREDTLFLRRERHGPATAYHLPEQPEVFLRLDSQGLLVGIDMTDFRRVLAKEHKALRLFLRAWRISQVMARVPGLRWVAETLDRGLKQRARDEVQDFAVDGLCPTA